MAVVEGPDVIADIDFDPQALKERYLQEREKRLREDSTAQYVSLTGEFAHFDEDPSVARRHEREALNDEVDVVIIGGGFGGLLIAARLRQAGVQDIRIIEKANDFGGTWYWNRYPGAMCDVESYVYLPLLEETSYIPKRKYSFGSEIFEHAQRIGRHFDLYDNACFQTGVTELRWRQENNRWLVSTDRGDAIAARFVAMALGPLDGPKLPGIPGIEDFKGHMFHTSRWDYAYTGGSESGGLTELKDKRVGIIGTGATAVQCIPALGESARELLVFQRTPSAVDKRNNSETDAEWSRSLEPGWQQRRMDNFIEILSGVNTDEDLVADGWTDLIGSVANEVAVDAGKALGRPLTKSERALVMETSDHKKMEKVRARVTDVVKDAATASALQPWYKRFCKRPCFHDEYLLTFNRPNVTLVDTDGRGVERITESGVTVDGVHHEIDC